MSKRIEINGKFFRKREGKLVEIPEEWVGRTVDPQTIRKRPSKRTKKSRKRNGFWLKDGTFAWSEEFLERERQKSGQF